MRSISRRHAALARALNSYKHSEEVVQTWDEGKFAVNDACAAEYLKALVHTGKISGFTAAAMMR